MSNKLNKNKEDKTLSYKIKEYRKEKNMTQEELSRKSNVSRSIISGLENGTITVTTTNTLSKIAIALNKKVSDIFLE